MKPQHFIGLLIFDLINHFILGHGVVIYYIWRRKMWNNKLINSPFEWQIIEIRQCYSLTCFSIICLVSILKSVLKWKKVSFSTLQHIFYFLVTYSLKTESSFQNCNDCLTKEHCLICKVLSKTRKRTFCPTGTFVYAVKETDCPPWLKNFGPKT